MSRVMCVWLPSWCLQHRQQSATGVGHPSQLLYDIDARRGPVVANCSQSAHRAGVRPGMSLAEARSLLEQPGSSRAHRTTSNEPDANNPNSVRVAPTDPDQDQQRLRQLAQRLQAFSPIVGLEDAERPECLLLDIRGCAHLFGGEYGLTSRVIYELHTQHLFARIATADTLGAAWAVAHYGSTANRRLRPLTQAHVVEPRQHPQILDRLPISALRIPHSTQDRLEQFDLRYIHQLRSLPRNTLPSRFGTNLLKRLDQAWGDLPEPIRPEPPQTVIRSHWLFEDPTGDRQAIQFVLQKLLAGIIDQLRQHVRGLLQLEFRLQLERPVDEHRTHTADHTRSVPRQHGDIDVSSATEPPNHLSVQIGLAAPCTDQQHLWELTQTHLEKLRLTAAVTGIQAIAHQTVPLHTRQQRLFDDDSSAAERHRHVSALVDRLSSRLGADRVVRPQLFPDHQPERAVRYLPLIAQPTSLADSADPVPEDALRSADHIPPRPILLDPHPRELRVETDTTSGRQPRRITYGQRSLTVRCSWGPERIETGWWRGELVRRNYYRIELTDGRQLWIFRHPDHNRWYHHGHFD